MRPLLQDLPVATVLHLFFQVAVGLDQESPGPASGVKYGLAEPRVSDLDHEPDDGSRGIELPGISRGIPHLTEHGLVKTPQGMEFPAGCEMDTGDLVDHISKEVTTPHTVIHALKTVAITSRRSSPLNW